MKNTGTLMTDPSTMKNTFNKSLSSFEPTLAEEIFQIHKRFQPQLSTQGYRVDQV